MRRLGSSRGDEVGVSGCRRCLRSEMADGMDSLVDVLGFVVMEWIIKLALDSQIGISSWR